MAMANGKTSLRGLNLVLLKARAAQRIWGRLPVKKRLEHFSRLARLMERGKAGFAKTITEEVGKPISESLVEVDRSKAPLEYYIEHGEGLLSDEEVRTDARRSYIRFEPIGIAAAFTPWNYPFWGIFRQLAPALLCGNALIAKVHSRTTQSAKQIEKLVSEAGFPDGLFAGVAGDASLIEPLIAGVETVVAITSPAHGRVIAEIAGRHLKRINLQLSGSDPFIVLEDADIGYAAKCAAKSRLINAGQDCVAAKRFIVRKEVCTAFAEKLVEEMKKTRMGDPTKLDTQIGPLGHERLPNILKKQVEDSVRRGARVLLGGHPLANGFFQPTVLTNVAPEMRVWKEETFGPIAPIVSAGSDIEALILANKSEFGLGASVWTKDLARAEKMAEQLEVGMVVVNGQPKSTHAMPFGGLKSTGMGRDFSKYGLLHFLNTKSILVFDHEK